MDTLFLHPERWDLMLDDEGNIAYAKDPYAKAQDVASAIKLFKGELYYDKAKGIPYFEETLGKKQSLALYQYRLEKVALSVPEVVSAKAIIQSNVDRTITGAIKFTDDKGRKVEVNL